MDKKVSVFKKVRNYFAETARADKEAAIEKYGLLGTDDVSEMVGKVGFIGGDGKYYPVRQVIYSEEEGKKLGVITHEQWARMYLYYMLRKNGNGSNPIGVLIGRHNFAMVYEILNDDEELELCLFNGERNNQVHQDRFDKLNVLWQQRVHGSEKGR